MTSPPTPPDIDAAHAEASTRHRGIERLSLILGALSLLAIGVDHIEQYSVDSYSAIPTIGTLFVLNFISAIPVAAGLLASIRRPAGRRTDQVLGALAVAGIAIAAGSLAGLLLSETGGLFGFTEHGYRFAIVLSIAFEVMAIVSLGVFLALGRARVAEARAIYDAV
jgi:hypothetical protein